MSSKPTVLIVDDEPEIGSLLKLFLEDDFDVVTFTDPRHACDETGKKKYDMVVSDIKMPFLSGLDVVKHVKKVSPSTHVILITGHAQTEQDKTEARELGAAGILFKPFGDPSKVVAYLNDVVNGGEAAKPTTPAVKSSAVPTAAPSATTSASTGKPMLMVIDDEPDLSEVLVMLLSDDYDVKTFLNPLDAVAAIKSSPWKAVLTDLNMPQLAGKEVVAKIKAAAPQTPVIVMTGHSAGDQEVKDAMNAGAVDLLAKPFPDPGKILDLLEKYITK